MSITPRPHGDVKVLAAGGIGQGLGIETPAFVGDLDANPVAAQQANHVYVLLGVGAVAMMDGIDQGLFRRQVYGKDVALLPVLAFELGQHFLENLPGHQGVAGNHTVVAPKPGVELGRFHFHGNCF